MAKYRIVEKSKNGNPLLYTIEEKTGDFWKHRWSFISFKDAEREVIARSDVYTSKVIKEYD